MKAIIVRALKDLVRELVEEKEKVTREVVRKETYLNSLQDKTSSHYHIHSGEGQYQDGRRYALKKAIERVNKFIEELENG